MWKCENKVKKKKRKEKKRNGKQNMRPKFLAEILLQTSQIFQTENNNNNNNNDDFIVTLQIVHHITNSISQISLFSYVTQELLQLINGMTNEFYLRFYKATPAYQCMI